MALHILLAVVEYLLMIIEYSDKHDISGHVAEVGKALDSTDHNFYLQFKQ